MKKKVQRPFHFNLYCVQRILFGVEDLCECVLCGKRTEETVDDCVEMRER